MVWFGTRASAMSRHLSDQCKHCPSDGMLSSNPCEWSFKTSFLHKTLGIAPRSNWLSNVLPSNGMLCTFRNLCALTSLEPKASNPVSRKCIPLAASLQQHHISLHLPCFPFSTYLSVNASLTVFLVVARPFSVTTT